MTREKLSLVGCGTANAFDISISESRFGRLESWSHPNVTYPFWSLYWNPEPGGCIEYHNRSYDLTPDKVILVPAYTVYSSIARNPFQHFYIHFMPPKPFDLVRRDIMVFPGNEAASLFERMRNCRSPFDIPIFLRLFIYNYLVMISPEKFMRSTEHVLDSRIKKAVDIIGQHLEKPLSNSELAGRVGLSLSLFYKLFMKELGISPNKYLLTLRMELALQFLQADYSIKEIARLTGYIDRFHFSKVFKRFFWDSPGNYRKMHRKNDQSDNFQHFEN